MGEAQRIEITTQEREKTWQQQGSTVLTASLTLPDSPTPGAAGRRFRRYYRLMARSFFRYCQMFLLPPALEEYRRCQESGEDFQPRQVSLRYTITLHTPQLLSLYTQLQEDGPRGFRLRRGDSWDLRTLYPLPLSALFPLGGGRRGALTAQLLQQARLRQRMGLARYHEDYARRIRRHFSPWNFYLTPEELCLFYPMYALGPEGEGIPVFSLPYGPEGPQLPDREKDPADTSTGPS